MAADPIQNRAGLFVQSTSVWDVQQIESTDVKSPEFKELLVRLYQNINNIVLSLNIKDSGYYTLTPFVNGQLFFPNPALNSTTSPGPSFRQVQRLVINFGALPNATSKSVAHGLTFNANTTFTRIYATATKSDQTSFLPIPYASASAVNKNIELSITDTNAIITTATNYSAYTVCYVVIEYLQT